LLTTIRYIYDDGQSGDPVALYDYIGSRLLRRGMQNGITLDLRTGSGAYCDAAGRPTRWLHRNDNEDGSPVALGYEFAYDREGNKLWSRSLHDASDTQRYAYDSAGRLTSYVRGDFNDYCDVPMGTVWPEAVQSRRWRLDGVGNWKTVETLQNDTPAEEMRSVTTFNEYDEIGAVAQAYDDNGNLVSDGEKTYAWDAFDRLRSVSDGSGLIVTYLYDAQGRRVKKDFPVGSGFVDVEYALDGWREIEEYEGGGAHPARQFVCGAFIDEPLAMDVNASYDASCIGTGDERYYYHQNPIYSVVALTDGDGKIVEGYEYDPYGRHVLFADGDSDGEVEFDGSDQRTELGASTIGNPFTFTGRRFDPETALMYYRRRYCNYEFFIARDPSGYHKNTSLYLPLAANPLLNLDPLGLEEYKSWVEMIPVYGPAGPPVWRTTYPTHYRRELRYSTGNEGIRALLASLWERASEQQQELTGSWSPSRYRRVGLGEANDMVIAWDPENACWLGECFDLAVKLADELDAHKKNELLQKYGDISYVNISLIPLLSH
jgi:RHS repeat-associated protein